MERHVLQALPSHSGESTTMLRFPWRPGDCTLTFGPGNSLQLLGAIARLLLIMRGANADAKHCFSSGPAARAQLPGKFASAAGQRTERPGPPAPRAGAAASLVETPSLLRLKVGLL